MDYVRQVKYRAVSFKKDHIAALYFTMSDIVHGHAKQLCTALSDRFAGRGEKNQKDATSVPLF